MFRNIGLGFGVFLALNSYAEVLDVAGPFKDLSSPTEYYHIKLTVPQTVVGRCIENAGMGEVSVSIFVRPKNLLGEYSDIYGDALKGEVIYSKVYKCTYPYLTAAEIVNSKFRDSLSKVIQVGHDYYDRFVDQNPNYMNADRDSTRHLSTTRDVYSFSPSTYTGKNAFLYSIVTYCNSASAGRKPATSIEELEASCVDSAIIAETAKYTTGPEEVLFIGLDPEESTSLHFLDSARQ